MELGDMDKKSKLGFYLLIFIYFICFFPPIHIQSESKDGVGLKKPRIFQKLNLHKTS